MEHTTSSSSDNTVSSQNSLPSSHDPGWNDPPEWALSSQHNSSGNSQNKRVLNKRVAFPLSSHRGVEKAPSGPSPSSHMMLPTLETSTAPTITTAPHKPLMAPGDKVSKGSESDFDKEQALTEVLTSLKFLMTERKMERSKVEEIQRRLDVMKFDWTENKLDSAVQKSILDMSKALLRRDVEQADKIHINLMTQHATACRAWMPAVRHLIFELKNECESSAVAKQSQSPLLPIQ